MPRKKNIESSHEMSKTPEPVAPPTPELQTTKAGSIPTKTNAWIDHVRSVSAKEGISYRKALSIAKESYKKD